MSRHFTAQFSFFTSDFPGKLPGISECPDEVFFWRVLFWVGSVLPSFLAGRIMDERDLSRLFIKCLIPCFFSSAALISSSKESHPFASLFAFSLRMVLKKETLLTYTIVCHIIYTHCHYLTYNNGFTLAFYFQTICFYLVIVSPLSKKDPKPDKSEISCNTFTKLQYHKQFHFKVTAYLFIYDKHLTSVKKPIFHNIYCCLTVNTVSWHLQNYFATSPHSDMNADISLNSDICTHLSFLSHLYLFGSLYSPPIRPGRSPGGTEREWRRKDFSTNRVSAFISRSEMEGEGEAGLTTLSDISDATRDIWKWIFIFQNSTKSNSGRMFWCLSLDQLSKQQGLKSFRQ